MPPKAAKTKVNKIGDKDHEMEDFASAPIKRILKNGASSILLDKTRIAADAVTAARLSLKTIFRHIGTKCSYLLELTKGVTIYNKHLKDAIRGFNCHGLSSGMIVGSEKDISKQLPKGHLSLEGCSRRFRKYLPKDSRISADAIVSLVIIAEIYLSNLGQEAARFAKVSKAVTVSAIHVQSVYDTRKATSGGLMI